MVEMTGFEPATPCPPDMYATGLRYISVRDIITQVPWGMQEVIIGRVYF